MALTGAVSTALLSAACCLGPLILALLGLGGAGMALALEPYRPLFLSGTVLLLGAGFGDGPANSRDGAGELYSVRADRIGGASPLDDATVSVFYGAQGGDGFGSAAEVVDMNGDGVLELAVVAAGADAGPNQAGFGIVYLIAVGP